MPRFYRKSGRYHSDGWSGVSTRYTRKGKVILIRRLFGGILESRVVILSHRVGKNAGKKGMVSIKVEGVGFMC